MRSTPLLLAVAGALVGAGTVFLSVGRTPPEPALRSIEQPGALIKVGAGGISRQEWEAELRRELPSPDAGLASLDAGVRRATLDALVEKELLFQKALTEGAAQDLFTRRRIVNEYVERLATERYPRGLLSGDELLEYYKNHPAEFQEPERLELDQVFFAGAAPSRDGRSDPKSDLELNMRRRSAYAQALYVRERAGDDGARLEQALAEAALVQRSGGPPGAALPPVRSLGWVGAELKPAEVWAAARTVPPGKLSQVIESADGYYIVRVKAREGAGTLPWGVEAVEQARGLLWRAKRDALKAELLEKLRARERVELEPGALDVSNEELVKLPSGAVTPAAAAKPPPATAAPK